MPFSIKVFNESFPFSYKKIRIPVSLNKGMMIESLIAIDLNC